MTLRLTFTAALLALTSLFAHADIAPGPEQVSPLLNGLLVPNIEVQDSNAKPVFLNQLLAKKPSLVLFYRGGWCPYCNSQLAGLKEIEAELDKLGFQVLAIAPEPPEKLKEGEDKGNYTLLSDRNLEASLGFGLAYYLDDKTAKRYQGKLGSRLKFEDNKVVLPVPAAYLVDTDGRVQFSYVNPNYKVRVQPKLLLTAAELMVQ